MAGRRTLVTKDEGLILPAEELRGRLRRLGRDVGAETPFRAAVFFSNKPSVGRTIVWSIQQGINTRTAFNGRASESVIELNASLTDNHLYVGITEEWAHGSERLVFCEVRLRFYVAPSPATTIGLPIFRLEWADRKGAPGELAFPGNGAGHPHWQFRGEDLVEQRGDENVSAEAIAEQLQRAAVDETDRLTGELSIPLSALDAPARRSIAMLGRFHFPANAGWAAAIWDPASNPEGKDLHASSPASCDELDNWIISAMRYVSNEIRNYAR